MQMFTKKTRTRRVNPKHAHYEKLRAFRETWEAAGGTRRTLRKARKAGRTLFPALPK
jgi:hypothetical protein